MTASAAGALPAPYLLGGHALREGRVQDAIKHLSAAAEDAAVPGEIFLFLAEAHFANADTAQAEEAFRRAVERVGNDAEALATVAQRALRKAWYTQAEICCRRFVEHAPLNSTAWFYLGSAFHGQRRLKEAVDAYERALELDPGSPVVCMQAGMAQAALGWYIDALETYEQLLRHSPEHAAALLEAGRMRFHFGQREAAARDCIAALRAGLPAREAPRLIQAKLGGSLKDWCLRNGKDYRRVDCPPEADLPVPRTLPAAESSRWTIYRGPVREWFVARVGRAEVFPQRFTVLSADGQLFVDGLVTTPQVYASKGTLVKYWNKMGDLLLEAPPRRRFQSGPCVLVGGQKNYFHWVYEAAARLMLVEMHAELRKLPLILQGGLATTQLDMLDTLGVKIERRLYLDEGESLLCEDLHVPSLVTDGYLIPRAVVSYLRERFGHLVPARAARRRLYLSRNRFGRRKLANEAELLPLLEARGFETVFPEEYSFAEQMALFGSAEAILALDGAALANLFITPLGARVGSIALPGVQSPHYHCVSHRAGHEFTYLHGLLIHDSNEDVAAQDVYLPRARLEKFLESF